MRLNIGDVIDTGNQTAVVTYYSDWSGIYVFMWGTGWCNELTEKLVDNNLDSGAWQKIAHTPIIEWFLENSPWWKKEKEQAYGTQCR